MPEQNVNESSIKKLSNVFLDCFFPVWILTTSTGHYQEHNWLLCCVWNCDDHWWKCITTSGDLEQK